MTATTASIGYGAVFAIESATPDTYVNVAEVVSVTPPALKRGYEDATHIASDNRIKEFIPGLFEYGEAQLTLNFTSAQFDTLLTAAKSTTGGKYRITLPDTSTIVFEGFFTGLTPPELTAEGKMEATASIRPKGAVTFTDNS